MLVNWEDSIMHATGGGRDFMKICPSSAVMSFIYFMSIEMYISVRLFQFIG